MKLYRIILTAALLCALSLTATADGLQDNLRGHINYLCSPSLLGRSAGSEGEKLAAGYLYDRLEEAGVTMLTGRDGDTFTIVASDGSKIVSQNVVGILEGEDPILREEYIVIGAHLDHLGSYTVNVDGEQQELFYPGAGSNASGVAALIEAARMLASSSASRPRSIVFAGFGAMEQEFAGSLFFASPDGFGQIGNVKMMINLDMLGRGSADNPFEIYPAMPLDQLKRLSEYVLEHESVPAVPSLHNGFVFPSDYLAFKQAQIPCVTFSTGIFREYRTSRDIPALLQFDLLAAQTVSIAAYTKSAASISSLGADRADTTDRVYALSECDAQPQFFRHGVQSFLDNWVYKYLKYPREAAASGIQGFERIVDKNGNESYRAVVQVSFIVEADGNVSTVQVERSVSEALDSEAVRVVSASPKWKPGTLAGKKVRTKIVIPVEYHLKKR